MIHVGGGPWTPSVFQPLFASAFISFGASLIVGDNASTGSLIAHASVIGQALTHTFSLDSDAGGQFAISEAGSLSVAGPLTLGSNTITVRATNGVDAPIVQSFTVVVQEVILTPTTMRTSVTDPLTGHVYTFSEAREVGQYWNGEWFVLGGPGNAVDIISITPVSVSVSTAAYTQPDAIDDAASTGAQTRWMHGAMVNPGQGRTSPGTINMGFDS